jgi:hypothetical protein
MNVTVVTSRTFSENTVREVKDESLRKTVLLEDDDEKHVIVFKKGQMAYIVCPNTRRDEHVKN